MSLHSAIIRAVTKGTQRWAKQRKAEERHASAMRYRRERLIRRHRVTIKEAAWAVMEKAYMAASDNGRLPATATQVMYAARGEIQERTGKQLDRQYFNQTPAGVHGRARRLVGRRVRRPRPFHRAPHQEVIRAGDHLRP
jgi:hypothetical protein